MSVRIYGLLSVFITHSSDITKKYQKKRKKEKDSDSHIYYKTEHLIYEYLIFLI